MIHQHRTARRYKRRWFKRLLQDPSIVYAQRLRGGYLMTCQRQGVVTDPELSTGETNYQAPFIDLRTPQERAKAMARSLEYQKRHKHQRFLIGRDF